MSTRWKLIILVLSTAIAGSSSLFFNDLVMRQVNRIKEETAVLESLHFSLMKYGARINQLDNGRFLDQVAQMEEARRELDAAFQGARELKALRSANATIASALDTILLLADFLKMDQDTLDERIKGIVGVAGKALGDSASFSVLQLTLGLEDSAEIGEIKSAVGFLASGTGALNEKVANTLATLEVQYKAIDVEIARLEGRARRTLAIILFLVVVLPALVALAIANSLAVSIKKIDVGVSRMKDRDLADRIDVAGSDELGRLGANVNDFTDQLSVSILRIQEASAANLEIKQALLESVNKVAATTGGANESALSISRGMGELDGTVRVTEGAVRTVEENLNRLEKVLDDQVAMTEETNASITEMIASIGNVNDITAKKKASLADLVRYSLDGGERLRETNAVIARVHDSVNEIRATTGVIAGISARTNLLAMNAAIEAAHAGDAGQGFAVVADEIRQLAEASSKNSKQIDKVMRGIIENIALAVESGKGTGAVFLKIDREVSEASNAFDEISRCMEELSVGGKQILEAMSHLNEISGQVQDGDVSMREAAKANRGAIEGVERISETTVGRVREIADAMRSLVSEMETITAVTRKADEISETLQREASMFKIDAELAERLSLLRDAEADARPESARA